MKINLFFFTLFIFASISIDCLAQVPQKFNYQGIARDLKGNPMAQQMMTLKLTVLPTADATIGEYEEIQTVTTNEFGLYTLQIGNGTPLNGEMNSVKWDTGNKYIKVAIDPKGGNDFVDAGTNQLLSVPYAIYADKAGIAKNTSGGDRTGAVNSAAGHVAGDANYLTKFTGLNLIGKSQLYENGINIGIGTTSPASRLHLYSNVAGVQQHLRMQNASSTGAGRFTMYNDSTLSYATFSKYGTAFVGGYPGLTTLYPYANLLAFGNNGKAANDGLGRFLISSGGNIGISIFKGGTSKMKFHADYSTENVGIGGNTAPVSRVHLNNTDGTNMDIRLTNNTTGHTATDGMTITMSGNNASINNRENASMTFGTNNTVKMTITAAGRVGLSSLTPKAKLDVSGTEDTIAYFSSLSNNYTGDGILRTEYLGSDMSDHVAIYGKSLPDSNQFYGIGIRGDGGYMGGLFYGVNKDENSSYGLIATGLGNSDHYGVFGYATSLNVASPPTGERVGIIGLAEGGLNNAGINANANSQVGTSAYGIYASAGGGGTNYAGFFNGDVSVLGTLSKGGGTFKIDHPQDPANKYLIHSFVESPDMKNIYDGNIISDANGVALVKLPSYFEAENIDFRYQLTVIGKDARAFVNEEIVNNQFSIQTSEPNTKVSWQVTGIRNDAWANANRVVPEVEKNNNEKGKYLYPELEGKPASSGIYNHKIDKETDGTKLSNPSDLKPNLKK